MLAWISALTSIPFVLIMFIVNYRAYHREWDRKTTLKRVLGTQVLCGIVSACFSMGIALAYMVVGLLIWYWRINLKFKTS